MVVRHLVGLDEVGRPDLGPVAVQVGGDRVHGPLHGEGRLGPAGAPVGGDDHRVGVEGAELGPVGARLVGAEQLGRGDDGDDDPVGGVGAVVVEELHVQAEQAAVVVEADADVVALAALVGRGDEVLAPVLGPLDLAPEADGGPGDQHLLGPGVDDLDPEAAADVGGHDLDPVHRHAQLDGQGEPDRGRGLGRAVDAQRPVGGVPAGVDAPALQGHGGRPLDVQVELQAVGGGGHGGPGVAVLLDHAGGHVVGHVVVDGPLGGHGGVEADHRGQRLVGDGDPLAGVLGQVAVAGHHHDHRLPDVADDAVGQRVGGPPGVQPGVRDQQGQRLGHRPLEVLVGVDGHQPVDLQGPADVDVHHPGGRVRAAHERRRQRPAAQVVQVAAVPGDQPRVLPPGDRLPHRPGRHGRSLRISAARRTEATMFW